MWMGVGWVARIRSSDSERRGKCLTSWNCLTLLLCSLARSEMAFGPSSTSSLSGPTMSPEMTLG